MNDAEMTNLMCDDPECQLKTPDELFTAFTEWGLSPEQVYRGTLAHKSKEEEPYNIEDLMCFFRGDYPNHWDNAVEVHMVVSSFAHWINEEGLHYPSAERAVARWNHMTDPEAPCEHEHPDAQTAKGWRIGYDNIKKELMN